MGKTYREQSQAYRPHELANRHGRTRHTLWMGGQRDELVERKSWMSWKLKAWRLGGGKAAVMHIDVYLIERWTAADSCT